MNQRPRNANHRQHRLRRAIPWVAGLLLVAFLVWGLRPRPAQVETVRVGTGALRATVNEEGKTRIRQRYTVAAPVPGQLRRIELKAGAAVRAQETIVAVIEPVAPALLDARSRQLAEARRDTAAAHLDKARAAHQFAAAELTRLQQLRQENVAAARELDAAQANATVAGKEVAAAASALQQAEAELADFAAPTGNARATVEIRAPASGQVLRVFEESARVVTVGTPLIEVGDPTDLEVVIEVLSRDGAAIVPGMKVELDQWGNGHPLEAVVRLVEPQAFTKVSALGVEEQRVNVIADLVAPASERPGLGDQFRVEARIVVWEAAEVVKVPMGALFRRGGDWAAYVLTGNRAELRRVEVGHAGDSEMQIVAGLRPGDEVILYPGDALRDRQRVTRLQVGSQ